MSYFCQAGSEPIGLPSQRLYFDDGVLCSIVGVQHPLCVFLDRVWFAAADALNILDPQNINAPRKASKFIWGFAKAFGNSILEDSAANGVTLGQLCQDDPDFPTAQDEITYGDLLALLLGQGDAALVKARKWWRFREWFKHCRCRSLPVFLPGAPISPPNFTPPSVPYCGGVINWPPNSLLLQSLEPLAEFVNETFVQNAAQLTVYTAASQQALQDDPFSEQLGDYWVIGTIGYSGKIGRGYKETVSPPSVTGCPDDFPFYLPVGQQRVVIEEPAGVLNLAVLLLPGENRSTSWLEAAITDLVPDTPNVPTIPAGTVLDIDRTIEYGALAGVCWYIEVRLNLPFCPVGLGRHGPWGTPPPNGERSDDEQICLDVPLLCDFRLPDCCGGRMVLMGRAEQLKLAKLFGFEVSQYE